MSAASDPAPSGSQMSGSVLFSVYAGIEAPSIEALDALKDRIMREVAEYVLERADVSEVEVGALR